MLTNRCRACNSELSESENKWDSNIQDFNDLCRECLNGSTYDLSIGEEASIRGESGDTEENRE